MSIMFMIFCVGVHAGVVERFPERAPVLLRELLRKHLAGAPTENFVLLHTMNVDPVTVAVTSLNEVNRHLDANPATSPSKRVTTVLSAVVDLPLGTSLSPEDQARLRSVLRPFLERARSSRVFQPVAQLYRFYDLWDEDDATFVMNEIPGIANLVDWYELLVRMAARESDDWSQAILSNRGDPLVKFALLDEIERLPERHYPAAMILVRNALRPAPGHRASDRESAERRVFFRLVDRWQHRYAGGDPLVIGALKHLETKSETDEERNFVRKFKSGRLNVTATETNLRSDDPLDLVTRGPRTGNVIPFPSCSSELARLRRSL